MFNMCSKRWKINDLSTWFIKKHITCKNIIKFSIFPHIRRQNANNMLNFLYKTNNCFRKASKMFLIYKILEDKYENETESESLALSSAICHLWYPTNYNSFKPESNLSNYLTQIIILTFLLKYYNNSQVMADFNLA